MNIQLGNLELKDVFKEEHLEKISSYLESNGYRKEANCERVKTQNGNYHIYDIPRLMTICGEEKQNEFIKFLQDNNLVSCSVKGQLGITYLDKA